MAWIITILARGLSSLAKLVVKSQEVMGSNSVEMYLIKILVYQCRYYFVISQGNLC